MSAWPGRAPAVSARAPPAVRARVGGTPGHGHSNGTPAAHHRDPQAPGLGGQCGTPQHLRCGVQRAPSAGASEGLPRLRVVAPDAAQQAVDEAAHVLLRRVDARDHLRRAGPLAAAGSTGRYARGTKGGYTSMSAQR